MNHSVNTRDRMIMATAELLEIQGYHATGLNQVTKVSSTPKGSLYFHFPGGKDELASEAIRMAGAEATQKLKTALKSSEDVGKAISAFVLTLASELLASDFRKACPVAVVAMETSATNEQLRKTCEQIYQSWFSLLEQRLIEANFNPTEALDWATFVMAAIEGSLLLSRNQRSSKPLKIVAERFENLFATTNPS